MSDKVIRIGSQQGFADQWSAKHGAIVAPANLNLVDFEIPRGMIIDMTKSYVAFNTEIQPIAQAETAPPDAATTGSNAFTVDDPINAMLALTNLAPKAGAGDAFEQAYQVPNAALIRNATISCDAGQIESIRRVDCLKSSMFNMEHDSEERKDDMNAFTAPKSVRGRGNQTSYFLDSVSLNTDDAGNALTGATSRQLARDVKVPLKSVFGIAEGADAWDTSKFGSTRIHMETNWKNIMAIPLGSDEPDVTSFTAPTATKWGGIDDIGPIANTTPNTTVSVVELTYPYTNPQQVLPFFVGQKVLISGTCAEEATISFVGVPVEILKLQYLTGAAGTANLNKVQVTFNTSFFANSHTAPVNLTAVSMRSDISAGLTVTVNRAELVLFTRPQMDTPSEYQYVTYSTEEDNGNDIKSFARGYTMEGNAEQMIVCLAPNGQILPSRAYESYRYAVDNEDQTGNRSIPVASPLQYDRLTRALDNQYTDWRNAQLRFANITPVSFGLFQGPEQNKMYDKPNSTIVETLPLSDRMKYVDLQIECDAGVQDIRIYKQMVRSIKA